MSPAKLNALTQPSSIPARAFWVSGGLPPVTALGAPMENWNVPATGWVSSELVRQLTV